MQVMCATFVDFCPVFSKHSAPQPPRPLQQSQLQSPHLLPSHTSTRATATLAQVPTTTMPTQVPTTAMPTQVPTTAMPTQVPTTAMPTREPPQPHPPYPTGSPPLVMAVAEQVHAMELNFQDIPELQQFVVANVQPTGKQLGTGAYGSVEEVEIPGATCAAKRIHEILLRMGGADAVKNITDKFVQECRLMSSLRHPHIVQFVGVCFLPESQLPALVMERLMISLADLLDNNPNVPLATKRSILHDVAKGLAYLHSRTPPIIHRDLTAKNVLLNSAMVAKLADLGIARVIGVQPGQLAATMTQAPGTAVYMPPEALEPNARYGTTIDVFSFGNLALYTLTQTFPELKAATYVNSKGNVVARTEVERRMSYIQQIQQQFGHQHPMVLMIERCLCNNPVDRPTVNHILQDLEGVRAQIPDRYGQMSRLEMEQVLVATEGEVVLLQQQLHHQLVQFQSNAQDLQSKNRELQLKSQELELKNQRLQHKHGLIEQLPPAFVTRFTAEELPPHIKKHIEEDFQEWEESLFKFRLFSEHPSSGSLSGKTLEVHTTQTLGEATERAYKVLELQKCGIQLQQCQLVRYNEYTGKLGKPFDEPKDTPLGDVLGGPPSFDLLVKIHTG